MKQGTRQVASKSAYCIGDGPPSLTTSQLLRNYHFSIQNRVCRKIILTVIYIRGNNFWNIQLVKVQTFCKENPKSSRRRFQTLLYETHSFLLILVTVGCRMRIICRNISTLCLIFRGKWFSPKNTCIASKNTNCQMPF